jgi:hypothetical protein
MTFERLSTGRGDPEAPTSGRQPSRFVLLYKPGANEAQ